MTGQNSQRGRDREAVGRAVTCSSGKFGYVSRRTAKESANKQRQASGPMRPYRCDECSLWHIGHKPKAVIRGEVTSSEWYEQRRGSAGRRHARRRHEPPHDGAGDHLEQRAAE